MRFLPSRGKAAGSLAVQDFIQNILLVHSNLCLIWRRGVSSRQRFHPFALHSWVSVAIRGGVRHGGNVIVLIGLVVVFGRGRGAGRRERVGSGLSARFHVAQSLIKNHGELCFVRVIDQSFQFRYSYIEQLGLTRWIAMRLVKGILLN